MANGRGFYINGEVLVTVRGNAALALSGGPNVETHELGLCSESVRIIPRFYHKEVYVDDYGPSIPAELLAMPADCLIRTSLVHYNPIVLEACIAESNANIPRAWESFKLPPAGTPMGGAKFLGSSGCHYIELNLSSPIEELPYLFKAAYLTGPPVEIPIGAQRSIAICNWRSIPYAEPQYIGKLGEPLSSGRVLYEGGD